VPTSYKIPGGSQGVAGAPDGTIGFSQQGNAPEQVGLLTPPTLLPLIETPEGKGDPFGAAHGVDGAFWFAMSANDGVARLTTTGTLTQLNGFAKGSFPRQLAPGPGNTLWVTLDMIEKVGRISGLEPPLGPPPPPTDKPKAKIEKGPKGVVKTRKNKAKVAFRFSSPDAGAAFQCRLFGLPPKGATKKGGKAGSSAAKIKIPAFKTCKSPKRYKLKPGRYRFQVRALNAVGTGDPVKRTFSVVRVAG
jgi:streptogramin lyase